MTEISFYDELFPFLGEGVDHSRGLRSERRRGEAPHQRVRRGQRREAHQGRDPGEVRPLRRIAGHRLWRGPLETRRVLKRGSFLPLLLDTRRVLKRGDYSRADKLDAERTFSCCHLHKTLVKRTICLENLLLC